MRINGYRCDVCSKDHLLPFDDNDRLSGGWIYHVPPDWFVLYQGPLRPDSEPMIFCSAKCLHQYAQKVGPLHCIVPVTDFVIKQEQG